MYGVWCRGGGGWYLGDNLGENVVVEGGGHRVEECRVYGLWFMVYGLWFMVYGLWFIGYGLWLMLYGIWFMVYAVEFKV